MHGLSGGGIGVAVIDTGITQVDGLDGKNKVVNGPDLSFDALQDDLRYLDLQGHGTNMAAIIGANNTSSGDGVAPDSTLINLKVGAGDGTVDVSQVIAAIDWVVQNRDINGENIRVINLAYNTDSTQDYRDDPLAHAVENAWNAGIVVVVAGGNDGRGVHRLGNPAMDPFVIAVGAAEVANNDTWKVPIWSSTGDGVRNPDVVAPGASILSAGVTGSYLAQTYPNATCDNGGDLLIRGSGTSQAAAVVAGAAALLIEQNPGLSPDQIKYLLTSTAVDLGAHPTQQGHGMIDLTAAITAPTPGSEAIQTHEPASGLGTLEAARGSIHVQGNGDQLDGEETAFGGQWDGPTWTSGSDNASRLDRPAIHQRRQSLGRRHLDGRNLVRCNLVWCYLVRCNLVRCYLVRCDMVRRHMVRCDMVRRHMVRCNMVRRNLVWCNMVRCNLVREQLGLTPPR